MASFGILCGLLALTACASPSADPAAPVEDAATADAGDDAGALDAAPDVAFDSTDADTEDAAPDAPQVEDTTSDGPRVEDATPDADPPLVIDPTWHDPDVFQVGTFNIDWLMDEYGGDFTPRNRTDFRHVASLVRAIDVEVLALQEIDGEGALDRLNLPPVWDRVVGRSGWSQNPAVLVRTDRARILSSREVRLPSNEFPSKDPLVVEVERLSDGAVYWIVVLHLHPFTDLEAVEARRTQAEEVAEWLATATDDAGVPVLDRAIVVGDLNDTHDGISRHGPAAGALLDHPALTVASDACDGGTTLGYESRIDHVLLGATPAAAWTSAGETCAIVRHDDLSPWSDYEGGWRARSNISSHRPIFVTLD